MMTRIDQARVADQIMVKLMIWVVMLNMAEVDEDQKKSENVPLVLEH